MVGVRTLNMAVNQSLDDIRELVENCLRDIGSETEGFPIEPLLRDLLQACRQGPRAREQMVSIVDALLNCWIASLERDMQALAPPSPVALAAITSRMRAAQQSLIHVQQTLERLKLWCSADRVGNSANASARETHLA